MHCNRAATFTLGLLWSERSSEPVPESGQPGILLEYGCMPRMLSTSAASSCFRSRGLVLLSEQQLRIHDDLDTWRMRARMLQLTSAQHASCRCST